MFGLEKKLATKDLEYDLEKEMKDPAKAKNWKKKVTGEIEEIKEMIRKGENSEEFHRLEKLLQGYLSAKKIMDRIK